MAKGGYTDLYDRSLYVAKSHAAAPDYGPLASKRNAKGYLSDCIRAIKEEEQARLADTTPTDLRGEFASVERLAAGGAGLEGHSPSLAVNAHWTLH